MPTWAGGVWPFTVAAVVAVVAFTLSTKLSIWVAGSPTLYTRTALAGASPPPSSISPTPGQLYLFVFFSLPDHSKKCVHSENTRTVKVMDKQIKLFYRESRILHAA